jgi:hypothetical protein
MAPERNPAAPEGRDAALRRLSHARRWLIAGAVLLTGIFSAVASQAFPGRTLQSKASATPAPAPAPAPSPESTPGSDQGSDGASIPPPSEAPQPSSSSDGAVSGGS